MAETTIPICPICQDTHPTALSPEKRTIRCLRLLLLDVRPLVHETFMSAGAMTERGWEALLARVDAAVAAPASTPREEMER